MRLTLTQAGRSRRGNPCSHTAAQSTCLQDSMPAPPHSLLAACAGRNQEHVLSVSAHVSTRRATRLCISCSVATFVVAWCCAGRVWLTAVGCAFEAVRPCCVVDVVRRPKAAGTLCVVCRKEQQGRSAQPAHAGKSSICMERAARSGICRKEQQGRDRSVNAADRCQAQEKAVAVSAQQQGLTLIERSPVVQSAWEDDSDQPGKTTGGIVQLCCCCSPPVKLPGVAQGQQRRHKQHHSKQQGASLHGGSSRNVAVAESTTGAGTGFLTLSGVGESCASARGLEKAIKMPQ